MRYSRAKPKKPKRTVSLTIDSDLYQQVRDLNVNASQIAEEALSSEVARRRAEALAAEIKADLAAVNTYVAENGSFADLAREHFAAAADDAI